MSTDKLPTLSYEIDGSVLTLRAAGTPTLKERKPVYDAVRADAAVPKGARLLLDIRDIDVAMYSEHAVVERFRVLIDHLGPKLGSVCAMIVPPGLTDQVRFVQEAGSGVGLQVFVFTDEPSARDWLSTYR
jgi:hypothetical protein